MFIKVTNATDMFKGEPLLINVNNIISVYEDHGEVGSLSTKIYGGRDLVWTVEESFEQVHSKINEAVTKIK